MAVSKELKYALRTYSRQPLWSVINVTGKAIEEIASEILSIMGKNEKY